MAGEITQIAGGYLRTASQYTPGSPARVVGGFFNTYGEAFGLLRIAGTLKITPNTPAQRRVVLQSSDTFRVLRGTYSDKNGAYAFEKVCDTPLGYTVIGQDQTGTYNADIVDGVHPA